MYNTLYAGNIDLTLMLFDGFVLFFIGLVLYLRREDRREGYPLEDDVTGRLEGPSGMFFTARPKSFILGNDHGTVTKPNSHRESRELPAARTPISTGWPSDPIGDPMQAGIGPGAYAQRAHRVDQTLHGAPKIVPLRVDSSFSIARFDADPRGMIVLGADRQQAGVVSDVWVDRSEYAIRYLEVQLPTSLERSALSLVGSEAPGRRVLVPMTMCDVRRDRRAVVVDAVLASQFSGAPGLENPEQITFYEEERVCAYYGGGYLYATSARAEPLI